MSVSGNADGASSSSTQTWRVWGCGSISSTVALTSCRNRRKILSSDSLCRLREVNVRVLSRLNDLSEEVHTQRRSRSFYEPGWSEDFVHFGVHTGYAVDSSNVLSVRLAVRVDYKTSSSKIDRLSFPTVLRRRRSTWQ